MTLCGWKTKKKQNSRIRSIQTDTIHSREQYNVRVNSPGTDVQPDFWKNELFFLNFNECIRKHGSFSFIVVSRAFFPGDISSVSGKIRFNRYLIYYTAHSSHFLKWLQGAGDHFLKDFISKFCWYFFRALFFSCVSELLLLVGSLCSSLSYLLDWVPLLSCRQYFWWAPTNNKRVRDLAKPSWARENRAVVWVDEIRPIDLSRDPRSLFVYRPDSLLQCIAHRVSFFWLVRPSFESPAQSPPPVVKLWTRDIGFFFSFWGKKIK